MEVLYDVMLALICLASAFLGCLLGHVIGYRDGKSRTENYYNGYRDEDSETINRLRGRVIWLEQSIKEARERLERAENEP